MNRPRPRLRTLIVFLLLGAIVNVAVAWGCAAFISLAMTNYKGQGFSAADTPCWMVWRFEGRGATTVIHQEVNAATFASYLSNNSINPTLAFSGMRAPPSAETAISTRVWIADARGWPMKSMWCEYSSYQFRVNMGPRGTRRPPSGEIHGGIWLSNTESTELFVATLRRTLPCRPIWPGFAINTILFAAILWLCFAAPGIVRRCIRIKRGQCPACGYPIGTSEVCTECGEPVAKIENR